MKTQTDKIKKMNAPLDDRAVTYVKSDLSKRITKPINFIDTRIEQTHLDSSFCTDALCNKKQVWIRGREFDNTQYARYGNEIVLRATTNQGMYQPELLKLVTLELEKLPVCFYYIIFDLKGNVRKCVILNQNFLKYIRKFYDASNPTWYKPFGTYIPCADQHPDSKITSLLAVDLRKLPKDCFMNS